MPNGEASKRLLLSLLCGPTVKANRSRPSGPCQLPTLDHARDPVRSRSCKIVLMSWTVDQGSMHMRYLHTMVRITEVDESLKFYCDVLGMREMRRMDSEKGRFTLIFLAAPADRRRAAEETAPLLELTYNWDPEPYPGGRNFGHLAFEVDDIYMTCQHIVDSGVTLNRPPRDGRMAFIRSPDNISVELLQKDEALEPREPWASMGNTGEW